jgi:hypothetical protein
LIQTPSSRGVSQLPLAQPGVRRVERINTRKMPSYLEESSRDVLLSRMSKSHRRAKPKTSEEILELAPALILPKPIPDKGINWIFLILGIVGSLHVLVMLGIEFNRTLEMRQGITRLSNDVAALESEVFELKSVTEHANDLNYREQLAREQGFAFPNEMRFITLPNE